MSLRSPSQTYIEFQKWIDENPGQIDQEDIDTLKEWFNLKPRTWFRAKNFAEIQNWIVDNLIPDLEAMKAQQMMSVAAGMPSESELEDAYTWIECTSFQGSIKQIEWAKSIAHNNHQPIVLAWKKGQTVPTKASWWIDNRNNIIGSLPL